MQESGENVMLDEHLLRFQKEQKYLLYDFETANLNLVWEENLPWELAWQVCTLNEVLEEKVHLINWEKVGRKLNVGDGAAMITGFYSKLPELLATGSHPKDVLNDFEKHLYNPEIIPIAHSGMGFDIYIHNIHRKVLGNQSDYSYMPRFLDTSLLARAMKIGAPFPQKREDLLAFQYKMSHNIVRGVKTSIKALCADFGIEYDETRAHQASYDCLLLNRILHQLLFRIEI